MTQVSKLCLTNLEEWRPSLLVRHPGRSRYFNQDQIISQQLELKFDFNALQRCLDARIDGFIDELSEKLFEKSNVVESAIQFVPPSDVGPSKTKEGLNPPDDADITCFEEWFHGGYKLGQV
ncbi:hypothetical protein Fot_05098 [Forsythia ovata]|uniref:Uncharacterized protein n=1 Tax=Forsythia ovata TaxID=205694 RepID=A0ABD1WP86_9LAMI